MIDPCAGSGSTLRAAAELNRNAYGFEVDHKMCEKAEKEMLSTGDIDLLAMMWGKMNLEQANKAMENDFPVFYKGHKRYILFMNTKIKDLQE